MLCVVLVHEPGGEAPVQPWACSVGPGDTELVALGSSYSEMKTLALAGVKQGSNP